MCACTAYVYLHWCYMYVHCFISSSVSHCHHVRLHCFVQVMFACTAYVWLHWCYMYVHCFITSAVASHIIMFVCTALFTSCSLALLKLSYAFAMLLYVFALLYIVCVCTAIIFRCLHCLVHACSHCKCLIVAFSPSRSPLEERLSF